MTTMTTTFARVALVLSLATASRTLAQPPTGPTNENARAHQAAGVAAYKAKDFATASREFAAAYAAERYSGFLFSWAQSDRQRGECASAVELYQRFLDTAPPESFAQLARDGIAACGATPPRSPPPPPPEERPAPGPTIGDDKLEVVDRTPRRPGFQHKLAVAFLGGGVAAGATSAVFYVLARGDAQDADRSAAHARVVELYDRAQDRLLISRITLGVSLGFVAASALRFALTDASPDEARVTLGVSPAGLFVAGAF